MSCTIRRPILALALAGILAVAARPVTARDLSSRPAAPARTSGLAGASGSLDPAWSWLHQAWMEVSAFLASTSPPSPPPCSGELGCKKPDEGPIIDPNGHH